MKKITKYIREPVNSITHGAGAILAIVGLAFLLYEAIKKGSVSHIIAFSMFGLSMVLLYSSSSLYHALRVKEKTLELFRKLDHSMIYVLIAGTYTPICLLVLDGSWKWGLFSTIWCLAAIGIIKKFLWMNAPRWLSTVFYLAMGWLAVIIFPTLLDKLPLAFLIWIGLGGLAYTLGAVIYGIKKPDPIPNIFGFHEIWHLFVMLGTFSHFWAIYWYLT
ncbi:PAQR family membrane homeostasis protein TrhA [Fodinibius saliphilus]|uniref:PAQR family membrane homeostasis protein TrhA n=1 Tax=Fodinibius saliphilus TaxID=1920650 RepID=UPI0011096016|nr:hemolysin III family protein [Fodinibius saliphilus]